MDPVETRKRFEEAFKLLSEESTSLEKFESIRALIKGYNAKIDKALDVMSNAAGALGKLSQGEIIELGAESLPEETEEEKKRKKAILTFIRTFKDLRSEVERVKNEFSNPKTQGNQIGSTARIIRYAKGPLGIVTIAAVAIVIIFGLSKPSKTPVVNQPVPSEPSARSEKQIQVIVVGDKKIPLSEIHSFTGPECDKQPHYHANSEHIARATDGTEVREPDPAGCGFGKVADVKVETVTLPN